MYLFFIYLFLHPFYSLAATPLYDIAQSFEQNVAQGPQWHCPVAPSTLPDRSAHQEFLGYPIASRVGIPACAIMTSKGIALMAQRGFDILTYKTVCSRANKGHILPNICYVSCDHQLTHADIGSNFYATHEPANGDCLTISNSLGNPCPEPDIVAHDIAQARASLQEGQLLIVSVFGQGHDWETIAHDFATTAKMAYQSGAQIIELNLSCPNITHGLFYKNSLLAKAIIESAVAAVPIPVIIKVGVFDSKEQMRSLLHAAAKAGSRGVCGINSVPVQVITKEGAPYFGTNRTTSGLSGAPLFNLAKEFIVNAREIITQDNLDLVILATGGITRPEQFQEFLDLGADVAMSATGAMWNLIYR